MAPIPLTLIGIIPGHWMLGADFTATSMIGFIALAGIIVRNSILLVDFAKGRVEEGMSVREAVVMAAEVRMRPIVITALALVIGSTVLLTDPIFQGMAVSLLFGSIVATFLTLVVIPLGCFSAHKSFNCKDGGGECPQDSVPPPDNDPSGGAPSGGAPSAGQNVAAPLGGRPPRLSKSGDPQAAAPDTQAEPPSAGGRPPRLAKRTEAESPAPVAEPAPIAAGGRPPRLTKQSDPGDGMSEAQATPPTGGRPPRLEKTSDTQAPAPVVTSTAPTAGRPPRLQKPGDTTPPASATNSALIGTRPPRLEKSSAPPAAFEAETADIAPVDEAETEIEESPAPVTPPAQTTAKPTALKSRQAPATLKIKAAPKTPNNVTKDKAPAAAAKPEVTAAPARTPMSPHKRKMRGIRIKAMDDGPDET